MDKMLPWARSWFTPQTILLLGWAAFLVYAFPGLMSTDSVVQLLEARTGPITDWHPPIMSLIWRAADRVVAGPFPMLVLQSVVFLLGVYAALSRLVSRRRAALVASAILLFPSVLAPFAVIWKDCLMASFLIAGYAALLSQQRAVRWSGVALIILATAMRYNAFAATLPLLVGAALLGRQTRVRTAFAAWVATIVIAFGTNALLTDERQHAWHNSLALFDIAGTVHYGDVSEAELSDALAGVPLNPAGQGELRARFHRAYERTAWWGLVHGEHAVLAAPVDAVQRAAVERAWWLLVSKHPQAYLHHRRVASMEVLGLSKHAPGAVWTRNVELEAQAAMIGQVTTPSWVQVRWRSWLQRLEGDLVFEVWAYLLLSLLLLPLARRSTSLPLLASGLCHELGVFFVAPSRDYRYSHWLVVMTCVAVVILFIERWRAGAALRQRHGCDDAATVLMGSDAR